MADTEYLTKKYQKWNNLKDDSDSETEEVMKMPTQFDAEGDADIVVSDELFVTPAQVERFRKLTKNDSEIWQVVVRKLRVWSASSQGEEDGVNAIPCRPYCILVNNLYPLGQVFTKKICDPPEKYPSPQDIMDITLQAMQDPPVNTPQHRPDKIAFPDKFYVGKLRKSFALLGIECSYLSESEGIDSYIQELSNHLIKNDLASVAEISERSGLLSGDGVTPTILKDFYAACARYVRVEPWNRLAERQAIQIDSKKEFVIDKKHSVPKSTVFASVIGSQVGEENIKGLAVFMTRSDLERRVCPENEKLAVLEMPELRRCAFCDKKASGDANVPELKRCTRCQCTFYCNVDCQRSHWKEHKVNCRNPATSTSTDPNKIVWGAKELSILFGGITSMTFDDLDAIDKHKLELAPGGKFYPGTVLFKYGEPNVPTASDLLWLIRGLHAMAEVVEKHLMYMQNSLVEMVGMEEMAGEHPKQVEWKGKVLDEDDHVVIKNSTVLTVDDVQKARDLLQKKKKQQEQQQQQQEQHQEEGESTAGATAGGSSAPSSLSSSPSKNNAASQEDDKNCLIM